MKYSYLDEIAAVGRVGLKHNLPYMIIANKCLKSHYLLVPENNGTRNLIANIDQVTIHCCFAVEDKRVFWVK